MTFRASTCIWLTAWCLAAVASSCGHTYGLRSDAIARDERVGRIHEALAASLLAESWFAYDMPFHIRRDEDLRVDGEGDPAIIRLNHSAGSSTLEIQSLRNRECLVLALLAADPSDRRVISVSLHDEGAGGSDAVLGNWSPRTPWVILCESGEDADRSTSIDVVDDQGELLDYEAIFYGVASGSAGDVFSAHRCPGCSLYDFEALSLRDPLWDTPSSVPDEVRAEFARRAQALASEGWTPHAYEGWRPHDDGEPTQALVSQNPTIFDTEPPWGGCQAYVWAFPVDASVDVTTWMRMDWGDSRVFASEAAGFSFVTSCVCTEVQYSRAQQLSVPEVVRSITNAGGVMARGNSRRLTTMLFGAWSIDSTHYIGREDRSFCGAPFATATHGTVPADVVASVEADDREQAAEMRAYEEQRAYEEAHPEEQEERADRERRREEREEEREAQRQADADASRERTMSQIEDSVHQFGQGLQDMSDERQRQLDSQQRMIDEHQREADAQRAADERDAEERRRSAERAEAERARQRETERRAEAARPITQQPYHAAWVANVSHCLSRGADVREPVTMGTQFLTVPLTNQCSFVLDCRVDFPNAPRGSSFLLNPGEFSGGGVAGATRGTSFGYDGHAPSASPAVECHAPCDQSRGLVDSGLGSCACSASLGLESVYDGGVTVCVEHCPAGYVRASGLTCTPGS